MNINDTEATFEISMTPDKLREIIQRMETQEKNGHIPGQIIRYKVDHNFSFVYRPQKIASDAKEFPRTAVEGSMPISNGNFGVTQ